LKIELKGHHFDAFEVIKAELQAVLNTLTEYDFQDIFKNGRSTGIGAYAWKGTTLKVISVRRARVSF
jgi:hypothetical protein